MNRQKIISHYEAVSGKTVGKITEGLSLKFELLEAYGVPESSVMTRIDERGSSDSIHKILFRGNYNDFDARTSLGMVERALADVMVEKYSKTLADAVKDDLDKYIRETYGVVEKRIIFKVPQTDKIIDGAVHEKFETALKFVAADEPVLLVGQAGSGKNVICKQIADAMNLEFYFSNAITQEYKLTGFIDANGKYHETQFYKAFTNGGLFMLDEIDASIPEVLVILNAAIANRYFDFPVGKVEAHKDFRIVAAANTYGTGASYVYSGRNQLDGASLDRFATIFVEYSAAIERSLSMDVDMLSFVDRFRDVCIRNGISHIVSYRAITRMEKLKDDIELPDLLKMCLIKNLERDDVNIIVKEFEEDHGVWADALRAVA